MNLLESSDTVDARHVARMVGAMAEVLGAKASADRIRGYVVALSDVPVDALREGFRRAIATWRYPDMPKPADIRAAVDAALAHAPTREGEHDVPYQSGYVCTACGDTGWVVVAERTDQAQPTVRRCECFKTNPKLVRPKTYAAGDER